MLLCGLPPGWQRYWVYAERELVRYRSAVCAQVAERLMAADCKSAAPWSYGGSNPPLCTRHLEPVLAELDGFAPRSRKRMWVALALLAALAGLAVKTIDPGRVRLVVVVLLGFFAVRIVLAALASR